MDGDDRLIHAYARTKDLEGVSSTWAAMKAAKCSPDGITRTAILNAFRAQGTLPTQIWHELNELQDRQPLDATSAADVPAGGPYVQPYQRHGTNRMPFTRTVIEDVALDFDDGVNDDVGDPAKFPRDLWGEEAGGEGGESSFASLVEALGAAKAGPREAEKKTIVMDLHGYSVMESLLLVAEQIEKVVDALRLSPERRIALDIITGIGNNSRDARPVVRNAVMERLKKAGLSPSIQHTNPGIVNVRAEALSQYVHDIKRKEEESRSLQLWVLRYTIIGSSIAAMFLIPALWKSKEGGS